MKANDLFLLKSLVKLKLIGKFILLCIKSNEIFDKSERKIYMRT